MVYAYPTPWIQEEIQHDSVSTEMGLAVYERDAAYCPRSPEKTVLYGVVAGQLETFLERQKRRDRHVPRFVERQL